MTCKACKGELYMLGDLGGRRHMRCRACGLESSIAAPPEEDERTTLCVAPFDDEREGVDAGELSAWETNRERES